MASSQASRAGEDSKIFGDLKDLTDEGLGLQECMADSGFLTFLSEASLLTCPQPGPEPLDSPQKREQLTSVASGSHSSSRWASAQPVETVQLSVSVAACCCEQLQVLQAGLASPGFAVQNLEDVMQHMVDAVLQKLTGLPGKG